MYGASDMGEIQKSVPAIISSTEASAWQSCRIITPNLVASYERAFGKNRNHFAYTATIEQPEIWELAKSILASRPDRLIFLDHLPHPAPLLVALAELYGERALPTIYVHLYGDFTLYTAQWTRIDRILKRARIRFIAASDRQAKLVRNFLSPDCEDVGVCPFPVDPTDFNYEAGLRESWRKKLGVRRDELAIVYTGRLSLQKNTARLTSDVMNFSKQIGHPVKLFLAGDFDDLAAPFFGVRHKPGFYFQYWKSSLETLDPELAARVTYLGRLDAANLRGLYHAGDAYLSLSLHHDEDFGMSPAEALSCGTPTLLTDWGGYASFLDDPTVSQDERSCSLIGVRITDKGLSISSPDIVRSLLSLPDPSADSKVRKLRSSRYLARYSIDAVSERIKDLHSENVVKFEGFSWIAKKHHEIFNSPVPFPTGPTTNSFYEVIYGPYTNQTH